VAPRALEQFTMIAFAYRILTRAEIAELVQIDRTESIDGIYYVREGALVLEEEHWDVPDWSPAEIRRRIAALQADYDRGCLFFGAFDGPVLAGMAVLDPHPLPTGVDRLNLAGLWVSHRYRGNGAGRALVQIAVAEAQARGARAVYVSATPSERTVGFYRSAGFELATEVDPDLNELEPEDIHLELKLTGIPHPPASQET
jgi:ribosomal protein S18 acetylase RimI-like enzyme